MRFVFKRISKPFRGEFLSANRQFIAPLPIPPATPDQRSDLAGRATALQVSHTRRRDLLALIARRMTTLRKRSKPAEWLFPSLISKRQREADAPANLDLSERRTWAATKYEADVLTHEAIVGERLSAGIALDASFDQGELNFSIGGCASYIKHIRKS